MADSVLIIPFAVLLALLVAFLYKIITLPPELAVPVPPSEPLPELDPPRPPNWRPAPARSAGPPRPAARRRRRQPGAAGYQARHAPAAAPRRSPPPASRRQPWGPAAGWVLASTGLTVALAGGWLFSRAGVGTGACRHRAAAACSQGYVLFTGAQILGGVICLAGIIIALAGLYQALRERSEAVAPGAAGRAEPDTTAHPTPAPGSQQGPPAGATPTSSSAIRTCTCTA